MRHYFSRLRTLRVGNFLAVANVVAKESHRPRVIILTDMVWCSLRYQAGYLDYQEFEFYSLNAAERRTWITTGKSNSIVVRYNQRAFRQEFSDKVAFNTRFAPYLGRAWIDLRTASPDDLRRFIAQHGRVMAKPHDGMGGAGIHSIEPRDVGEVRDLHARLSASGQYLVESFISQDPAMASLSETSVNSLRVITFFDGATVHVLEAVLRMGNGGDVDNYGRGGMYTVLDEKSGIAPFAAFDQDSNIFTAHPSTGTRIVGFRVPRYDDVLTLLDEVARIVPEIPYVGWDVAIGVDGPLIIEGNYNTGVFQMKPSITGSKIGLLPRFQEVINF